ncbi:DUF2625 family protein [bacterium]|nr:DUF2625 family protein [bacterium]QQR57700.1 MAG: DUF2625 family protein [Candidatus Melainabacteria bacterium]
MKLKPLKELINLEEPCWPYIQEWIKSGKNHVEVLPPSPKKRDEALVKAQVTTRSAMGAIIYETGGILVDHGWLRIYGSGHERLDRSLPFWNEEAHEQSLYEVPYLLIADDAIGGFYALDYGFFGAPLKVFYYAHDIPGWENTGLSYSDFVGGMFDVDFVTYSGDLRWSSWQEDVAKLKGNEGFTVFPPYWAEFPKDKERTRGAVPVKELFTLTLIQ